MAKIKRFKNGDTCPCCGLYIQWKVSPDGAVKKWNRRAGV